MKLLSNFSKNSSASLSSGVRASSPTTAFIAAASRPMAYLAYLILEVLFQETYQLIRHIAMILSRHTLTNGGFHQTRKRRKDIDRRIYLSVVQLTINKNLSFCNISRQIRNRMGNIYT